MVGNKGYKAHVCSTPEGVVLSTVYNSKRHDSKNAPVYFQDNRRQQCLVFLLQTLLYSQQLIFIKLQIMCDIFPVNPITAPTKWRNKLKFTPSVLSLL